MCTAGNRGESTQTHAAIAAFSTRLLGANFTKAIVLDLVKCMNPLKFMSKYINRNPDIINLLKWLEYVGTHTRISVTKSVP
jgi:hypothetical protein